MVISSRSRSYLIQIGLVDGIDCGNDKLGNELHEILPRSTIIHRAPKKNLLQSMLLNVLLYGSNI